MRNYLIILTLTALVFGCTGKNGKKGDAEPNNTIEEAGSITPGETFQATIDPQGDRDWYKVEVDKPGYIRVQASDVPEAINPEITFALFDQWEPNKEKGLRGWRRLPDALPVSEAGTYYFVIIDDYDDNASEEPFQLKVDFLEEFDEYEPNNAPEEAAALEFGQELSMAVYPVGDQDWFRVITPEQGYLVVSSKDVPEGIQPEVRFSTYDEWADPKVTVLQNWRQLPAACFIPDSGEYHLTLIDDYNDACSETPFSIKIDFLKEMDANEPNDDFKKAKTIKRGDTLQVAIFPTGDQDYFKINTGNASELKFLTRDVPGGITPEMRLYTIDPDDMDKLVTYSEWNKLPVTFDVEENKEYYVLLIDDYNDAGSQEVFMIRVE